MKIYDEAIYCQECGKEISIVEDKFLGRLCNECFTPTDWRTDMEKKMHFAGIIDSEETMWGQLPDGRQVYVHMLTAYSSAPEGLRDDPEYWRKRIEACDFTDPENAPIAWIDGVKLKELKTLKEYHTALGYCTAHGLDADWRRIKRELEQKIEQAKRDAKAGIPRID